MADKTSGWTRKQLFRVLVAMLYLWRTGDARTYWIILPKRLKVVRDRHEVLRRRMGAAQARAIAEWFTFTLNHHRTFGELLSKPQEISITDKDFRIPFRIIN